MAMSSPPVPHILHVDMDAFFVSVELLRHPELVGQPVIVGGSGNRGVVAAASYAARSFGIYSAMPSTRARRLCPHAVFLPGDHARYAAVSSRVMALFKRYTPDVEPLSLDEAFLDIAGAIRLFGSPDRIAQQIRDEVYDQEGLTCSVGVSAVMFLAKLASEAAKPKVTRAGPQPGLGVKIIEPGSEIEFLHRLPAKALWGVGRVTLERLERIGVESVADIAALPVEVVMATLGKAHGRHLHELAHARDPRRVESGQAMKSVSHEETFSVDRFDRVELEREIVRMADAVGQRLRDAEIAGRTVTLKVRFGDFTTITRSATQPGPVDSGIEIARIAKVLLSQIDPTPGIRLLGVGVHGLTGDSNRQLTLDLEGHEPTSSTRQSDADTAIDDIRRRFGDDAIGPASLAEGSELRTKRRGDQQWGPSESADNNR